MSAQVLSLAAPPRAARPRLSDLTGALAVFAAWEASRWFAASRGVHFDAWALNWSWQVMDVHQLAEHLTRSLWYLHSQPPGFNLLIGLGLKLTMQAYEHVYPAVFVGFGLALHLGLYALLRLLRVPVVAAVLAAGFFAWTPSSILYENWLFYTYPAAALLVVASVGLAVAVKIGSRLAWTVFFAALAALALSVAIFHLVWCGVCAACAWWLVPAQRGRILKLAAPWLGLVTAFYLKNLIVFGFFGGSSWFGMNFARIVEVGVPLDVRQREVGEGMLSPLAITPSFSELPSYPRELRDAPPGSPNTPVLTEPHKTEGNGYNFNQAPYVQIARLYAKDSLKLLRRHPGGYFYTLLRSWLVFLIPPSEYFAVDGNRDHISDYANRFNMWIYGMRNGGRGQQPSPDPRAIQVSTLLREDGLLWAALGLLSLGFCGWRAARDLRGEHGDRLRGVTLAFMCGAFLFVSLVGNCCEYSENHRFRFMVEPLLLALIAVALTEGVRGVMSARRPVVAEATPSTSAA